MISLRLLVGIRRAGFGTKSSSDVPKSPEQNTGVTGSSSCAQFSRPCFLSSGGPDGDRHAAAEPAPGHLQDGPAPQRGGGKGEDEGAERAHRVLPLCRVLHRRHHHHGVSHTFCKSCIVKYLQSSKYCPMCNTKIYEMQPLLNLKLDRVMQDLVYKLVRGLQESEEKRIREFYQSRGLD
ncbi:hypothetical protein KIL84_010681 [Mauremys mutica]|uniref:Zinc finger C3HC4 RING-type domain-containing protein n=1 Tax=Mauremys mutica TaxID=74926 RepID=A0A9D3X819_9SAUR|nr:hypothetical protein KIL84_010681 [Mauremys mutica]